MNDRQRLTDLLLDTLPENGPWVGNIKGLVDHLIANGVTIQKHGRWDRNGYCSECDFWTCYCGDYHYCPNCGADMREVDNAEEES